MISNCSTVIALWAKANKGKTQTLNLLIQKLHILFGAEILDGTSSSDIEQDCWCVLQYGGKKIGVITGGDDEQYLKIYFEQIPKDGDVTEQ